MAVTTTRREQDHQRRRRRRWTSIAVLAFAWSTISAEVALADGGVDVDLTGPASGQYVAVSGTGNATTTGPTGVAVSGQGTSTNNGPTGAAASGTGRATNYGQAGAAASGTNNATSNGSTGVAVSGTGTADGGPVGISGHGNSDGSLVDVSGRLTWVYTEKGPFPVGATIKHKREVFDVVVAGLADVVHEVGHLVPSDPERYLSGTVFAGEGIGCGDIGCHDLVMEGAPIIFGASYSDPDCYWYNSRPETTECAPTPMYTWDMLFLRMVPRYYHPDQLDYVYWRTTVRSDNAAICRIRSEMTAQGAHTGVTGTTYDMWPPAGEVNVNPTGSTTQGRSFTIGQMFGYAEHYETTSTNWLGQLHGDYEINYQNKGAVHVWGQWSSTKSACPYKTGSYRPVIQHPVGTMFFFPQPPGHSRTFNGGGDLSYDWDVQSFG